MTIQLDEGRRAALTAFCDTIVPSIEREPDPDGLWALSATALGVPAGVDARVRADRHDPVRVRQRDLGAAVLSLRRAYGRSVVPTKVSALRLASATPLTHSSAMNARPRT